MPRVHLWVKYQVSRHHLFAVVVGTLKMFQMDRLGLEDRVYRCADVFEGLRINGMPQHSRVQQQHSRCCHMALGW